MSGVKGGVKGEDSKRRDSYHRFQSRKLYSIRNKKKPVAREHPQEGEQSLSSSLRISILSLKAD